MGYSYDSHVFMRKMDLDAGRASSSVSNKLDMSNEKNGAPVPESAVLFYHKPIHRHKFHQALAFFFSDLRSLESSLLANSPNNSVCVGCG